MSLTPARVLTLAVALLLVIPLGAHAAPGNGNANGHDKQAARNADTTQVVDCFWDTDELAGTATFTGTTNLWPPNHKMTDGHTVTWTRADDDGDAFAGMFTASHNQYVDGEEMNGAGNTEGDISPAMGEFDNMGDDMALTQDASQDFSIRAERSGRDKDGRVYTISGSWTITDTDGDSGDNDGMATCEFTFQSYVPHDQGNRNNGGNPLATLR